MRTSSTRRARAAAVLATALALGGLSLAAAPSADAVVLDPASANSTQIQFDDDFAADCTITGAPADSTTAVVADGVARTTTVNASATDTHNTDAGDVTTINATASRTVTASQADGQLSHVNVRDSFSATVNSARGAAQQCDFAANIGSNAQLSFDLVRPTYVTVAVRAKGMLSQAIVSSDADFFGGPTSGQGNVVVAAAGGKSSTGQGEALLPAGTFYVGFLVAQAGALAPNSASGESTIDISFDTPGAAEAAATGKGTTYVALPDATDCAAHAATVTWAKKAGKGKHRKVKKAVFKVGTTKVGAVKKPKRGASTSLRGLPATGAFTVTGTLKLKNGKTVVVSRDYGACS